MLKKPVYGCGCSSGTGFPFSSTATGHGPASPPGVLIYALLLQFLSGRIWIVNIEGNDQVPEASIREVLEPLGVREGGDFRKLDVPSLQLTALQSLPDLTWLAVNLEGSTVHVKVRERGSHAPMEDGAFPSNIKAARGRGAS